MTDEDRRAALHASKLPEYIVGGWAGWLSLTCPRADCEGTFLVDPPFGNATAPCPYCSKVSRLPGATP